MCKLGLTKREDTCYTVFLRKINLTNIDGSANWPQTLGSALAVATLSLLMPLNAQTAADNCAAERIA